MKAIRRSAKLYSSQNTVAKVVQTFKKDGTATISQRRPGRPRKLTPRQERLLMRRVEENRHASLLQLSKGRKPNWGDYFPWHNTAYTAEEWHAWVPSTKEASPKAQAQKTHLEFARAHADKDEDYWDSILYTLWDQDKCFWNWWLQNCVVSQR